MKWILVLGLVLLGYYGSMVGPAQAGERWSAGPCADVGRLRAWVEHQSQSAPLGYQAAARQTLLLLQEENCGVDVRAEQDADNAALGRALEAAKRSRVIPVARPLPDLGPEPTNIEAERSAPEPRQPMNCTTVRLGDDMSHTSCD